MPSLTEQPENWHAAFKQRKGERWRRTPDAQIRKHQPAAAIRSTEMNWVHRYIKFRGMKVREELLGGEPKVEAFLSDLAVDGHVSASTQNQALLAVEG